MTTKSQDDLRHEVIHIIGELILDEIEFKVDDAPKSSSKAQVFYAVRDDLAKEISHKGDPDLEDLYDWAKSGPLFAEIWEQWVRLHPEQEPWPKNTQAAQWRAVDYGLGPLSQEESEKKLARMKAELPPAEFAKMQAMVTLLADGKPHTPEEMANILKQKGLV